MNLVLLKLVEYLGHTNALISGLAYDEVRANNTNTALILLTHYRFKRYLITPIFQH